jgi:hypothetical protein
MDAKMLSSIGRSFHALDRGNLERNEDSDNNYQDNNYQDNNNSSNSNQVESDQVESDQVETINSSFELEFKNGNSTVDIYSNFSSNIIASSTNDDGVNGIDGVDCIDATVTIAADPTTTDDCTDSTTYSIPTEVVFTTCDVVYDRLQTHGSLPMLDFRRELEKILLSCGEGSSSPLEAYNLFNHYIDLLRDYYYELFIEQCKELTTRQECMSVGDEVLQECTAAMRGSLPHSIILQRNESSDGHFTYKSNGYNWSIEVYQCPHCSPYLTLPYLIAKQRVTNNDFAM